jgi:hypothetical protein
MERVMRSTEPAPGGGSRRATAIRTGAACLAAWLCATPALGASSHADDDPPPATADKSGFTLLNPTPRVFMRVMSTDRPDMTESPYTVDAGHVQVELSFADWTYDHRNADEQTVRTLAVAPMLLKVGLLNDVDLQVGLDPYTRQRTTDRATDTSETSDGFGDTAVRLKVNLWGNDAGEAALALMPFVKLPTAPDDLGNGEVEGGLIVPFAIALPNEFALGLMGEVDINRSAANDRYVVDFVHTATLGRPLVGELGAFIEYAGFLNLNGDEDYRGYFNTGLTYALTPDVQFDAGARVGLTEAADDFGVFAGVSLRY